MIGFNFGTTFNFRPDRFYVHLLLFVHHGFLKPGLLRPCRNLKKNLYQQKYFILVWMAMKLVWNPFFFKQFVEPCFSNNVSLFVSAQYLKSQLTLVHKGPLKIYPLLNPSPHPPSLHNIFLADFFLYYMLTYESFHI